MHSLFQPNRLLDTFLERVAFGEQERAERLFTQVYQGNVEKIQVALCCQRRFTDYSGRTFHCSAYEYAYWAKDTHMCRMLERYMNDATKTTMLERIDKMESIVLETGQPMGLSYQQNGAEHRSAHFNFAPLIRALQGYINCFEESAARFTSNLEPLKAAWIMVGKAQRDVPAHVAQEYCRRDRCFDPLPSFNVDQEILPRVLAFYNWDTGRDDSWFPLGLAEVGLGFDFAIMRGHTARAARIVFACFAAGVRLDLEVITLLNKIRTIDLTHSRDNLITPKPPCMSI
jgi:hypothetical protein